MARVPTYDNLTAAATTVPDANVSLPNTPNAEQENAQQLQGLGDATQRAGDATSRIALSMQDQVNQTRVNDAVNRARVAAQDLAYNPQTGYLNLKGDAALTRPDGQALPDEYGDKLSQSLSGIAGTLGNDEQRRQFQMNAAQLQEQFHGQVESHMLGEFRSHALSVQDGTIDLAVNDAKLNWSNPDLIGPSLNAAKAAVVEKGHVSGWSGAQTDAALLTTTSKVHTDVVMAALENNNPNYALSYLNARKGEMTADDILRVQGHVNQNVWLNQSLQAVQGATTAATTAIAPTNFDRMTAITAQTESGGRETNPDGTTVTSPKGAQGVMQVMPATAANPGFGIAPADLSGTPQQQAAERARVGTQYLQALVQKYGDPAKAWAAYNAGPGAVDAALKASATDASVGAYRSGAQPANDWLTRLPAETQAYVTKNIAALGSPDGGRPARPTELDFINSAMAQLPPGASPQLVNMTRTAASTQFGVINKSFAEQGQHALSDVQNWLFTNKASGVTVADVPPALMDPLMRYAPGDARNLEAFSKAVQKGDTVTNLSRYNDIVANMDQYAKMSDPAWNMLQTELAPSTFQVLSKERASYMNGTVDDSSGGLNRAQINRSLNEHLSTLQIPTSVKPGDTSGNERLGGIRMFVDQSIFQAQRAAGQKMTPDQIATHIDGLFAKDVTFKNTVFGFETGGKTSSNLMSLQANDIPSAQMSQIKAAYAAAGKTNPTNTDLINAYRTWKMKQQ